MNDGLVDMARMKYIPEWKIVEDAYKEYGWIEDEQYLKDRLVFLRESLDREYNLQLAREKQSLYFMGVSCSREDGKWVAYMQSDDWRR